MLRKWIVEPFVAGRRLVRMFPTWWLSRFTTYGLILDERKQFRAISAFRAQKAELAHLTHDELRNLRSAARIKGGVNQSGMWIACVGLFLSVIIGEGVFSLSYNPSPWLFGVPVFLWLLLLLGLLLMYNTISTKIRTEVRVELEELITSILEEPDQAHAIEDREVATMVESDNPLSF